MQAEKLYRQLALMFAVKMAAVVAVGYCAWLGITSFLPKEEPWPPRDAADETRIIAHYKQRLRIGNTPVSILSPATAAVYFGRVIDHAVRTGDRKSARGYAGQAIVAQVAPDAEKHLTTPEAQALFDKVVAGRLKRNDLNRVAASYDARPPATALPAAQAEFDREFRARVDDFLRTPFSPADCPELAQEMAAIYRARLEPRKADPRLKAVTAEIELCCLPPRP
jgi:hypothetical protein